MTMATKRRQMTDDELWEHISNEVALAVAGVAEDETEPMDELDQKARDRIRRLRLEGFEKLEALNPEAIDAPIPERIQEMPLDEVADRLDQIFAEATGLIQVQPYDLDDMDEDALRVMLWDLEEQLRRAG